jgi:hypothetical protein
MLRNKWLRERKIKATGCERLLEISTVISTSVENTNPLNSAIPLLPHRLEIGGYRFADRRKA